MKALLIILFFYSFPFYCKAENTDSLHYPKIGQIMPSIGDIKDYISKLEPTTTANKPTVLIYWARYCASCIQSFPKYNALYAMNRNHLNVVLVAPEDSLHKKVFKIYKSQMGLDIKSIFDSTIFYNRVRKATPNLIWIDKKGVVKAETTKITESMVERFLKNGETGNPPPSEDVAYESNNSNADGPINLGEENILFGSVLLKWENGMPENGLATLSHPKYLKRSKVEFLKTSLKELYRLAYFGKANSRIRGVAFEPLYETKDSNLFISPETSYSYSLKVPAHKSNKDFLMKVMQNDLMNYFAYNATIEERSYPCLNLTIDEANKNEILTKSDTREFYVSPIKVRFRSVPLSEIIEHFNYIIGYDPVIVNKTGLPDDALVDIEVDGALYDRNNLSIELQKNNLRLVPGEVMLKSLVVRDQLTNRISQ